MGLFDLFKKKNSQEGAVTGQKEREEGDPYYGDLAKTNVLCQLVSVPRDERDKQWQKQFLENIAEASFVCGDPQVIEGPDGYPYFTLVLPEPFKEFQCYVIKYMKDDFLLEKGLGVVINPDGSSADWVLSYGDILSYHLSGEFYQERRDFALDKQDVIEENEKLLVGQPSESYLPQKTRKVLKKHLNDQGIKEPKVFLMARKRPKGEILELVLNISRDQFPNKEQHNSVMESLAWFLPRYYSVLSFEKNSDYADSFEPL